MSYNERFIIENAMVFAAPVGTEWPERWEFPRSPWEYLQDTEQVYIKWEYLTGDPVCRIRGFVTPSPMAVYLAGWRPGHPERKRAVYLHEVNVNEAVRHYEHPGQHIGMVVDRGDNDG